MVKQGIISGGISGIFGSLCCLGPTVLVLLGLGVFFGISSTCFSHYRLEFFLLGLAFLALSFFFYFKKRKKGQCDLTPKQNIKHIVVALMVFLITYAIMLTLIVPALQTYISGGSCSLV